MESSRKNQGKPISSLGPLEMRVMNVAWERGRVTVRDVADALTPITDSAYTTVMTVMSRLAEKGLLKRKPQGRAYAYTPRLSRQDYEEALSRSRVRTLIKDFGDLAVTQFAEELEHVDPERARKLGEMLRKRARK